MRVRVARRWALWPQINAANPFAQLNKSADTAAPGSPTRRSSGKEGNPFAKNDGEEADKEGNPFA